MGKQDRGNNKLRRPQHRQHVSDAADYGGKALAHELAEQGLYIKEITGDGNCLFRSLADQLGEVNTHGQIRHDVVQYLRQCKEEFTVFIEEDYDRYLDRMANDGVYGDNLEIVAYSRVQNKAIKIYQPGLTYVVFPEGKDAEDYESSDMLHIVYHSYEHYSSVRNEDGPHEGPSRVQPKATILPRQTSRKDDEPPSDLEKICLASVPDVELVQVRTAMKQFHGNVNAAIEHLLEEQSARDGETGCEDMIQSSLLDDPEVQSAQSEVVENDLTNAAMLNTHSQESNKVVDILPEQVSARSTRKLSAREKKMEAKKIQKAAARDRKRKGKAHVAEEQNQDNQAQVKMISI